MTYSEAIDYLYKLRWFGAKFGLSNTLKLAQLAGNPQKKLRFIHVAGTNGKGSTCALLESIYRTAGFKVGLFTSPHLVAFGERIQVDRKPVSESDIVRQVLHLQSLIKEGWGIEAAAKSLSTELLPNSPLAAKQSAVEHPTFFEVVTVMALLYFLEKQCELVVWETGLGGRLDATNIVDPLASVITNVHYDHQQWLGNTLQSIAAEKGGIIKPGRPVLTATTEREALDEIKLKANAEGAALTIVTAKDLEPILQPNRQLPLMGEHQRRNAALAVATVRALAVQLPVTDAQIVEGIEKVNWPGRLQLIKTSPQQKILLDGAHNLDGLRALAAALTTHFPNENICLILGILADKNWQEMCQLIAPFAKRIYLVPVQSERTADAAELEKACKAANPASAVSTCSSMSEALDWAREERFVLVTGSLYLVGEVMEMLNLSPGGGSGERVLNEWGSPGTQTVSLNQR
jgi:dihydrofolate synthase/folylpolyglutamate synthase